MADYILLEGDQADFSTSFLTVGLIITHSNGLSAELEGSGKATLGGKKVCIAGDESKVLISGCMYKTPIFTIDGSGNLKIESLATDQQAQKTKSNGKAVLLKGKFFTATFEVVAPAQTSQGIAAPAVPYTGYGQFKTNNTKWKAT